MNERTLAAVLAEGRVFDLAVDYFPDMPHLPRHIPYAYSVVRNYGDVLMAEGVIGPRVPGVTLEGARWLSEQGIALAGSDTFAFERIPSPSMPVHCHFLVERGIFLLEVANLEALSAAGAATFLLAVLPLKLKGATGSPVRPVAIL